MAADGPLPALPPDAVLVHIGMHKTGTTAIQALLAANRDRLKELGVHYPGPRADHHVLARAFTQRSYGPGGVITPPPPQVWTDLVAEVALDPGRVVLSSEFFIESYGDGPARLVRDLGPHRVHVVVGVRNLAASAVAIWQQSLKDGRVLTLERWAEETLPRPGQPPRKRALSDYWNPAEMVERWCAAAGADRMTVVVLDGRDRSRLPATFEQLLGLPTGMLVDQPPAVSNRSMTGPEAEFVRQVNLAAKDGVDFADYRRLVRFGAVRAMVERRTPPADEPRPALPEWAVTELRAAGVRAAEGIAATGVRVVGDLAALADGGEPAPSPPLALPTTVPVDAAVQALLGAVRAAPQPRTGQPRTGQPESGQPGTRPPRPAAALPARELVQELGRRARRRGARVLRRRAR